MIIHFIYSFSLFQYPNATYFTCLCSVPKPSASQGTSFNPPDITKRTSIYNGFIAPADGWIKWDATGRVHCYLNGVQVDGLELENADRGEGGNGIFPVSKGDKFTVSVHYVNGDRFNGGYFMPCKK